jgi:hypothetical protein
MLLPGAGVQKQLDGALGELHDLEEWLKIFSVKMIAMRADIMTIEVGLFMKLS